MTNFLKMNVSLHFVPANIMTDTLEHDLHTIEHINIHQHVQTFSKEIL